MAGKLVALILIAAAAAAALLAVRQQRVEAAHELAEIQRSIAEFDQSVWQLRIEIASRTSPAEIGSMIALAGPMEPVLLDWCYDDEGVLGPGRNGSFRLTTSTPAPPQEQRQ